MGVYVSMAAQGQGTLRELARAGLLADVASTAEGPDRLTLVSAAYDVAWPVVFSGLTRRLEERRGHPACATGVRHLADDCLDRFHDDVEAVVNDLLAHARRPVFNLEAWIARRLTAATVDGHRRRRGQRGALQRPRLPVWLAGQLGNDRWLATLATRMLVWVGIGSTAGQETWPLEAWAQERAAFTGDWQASDPATVSREVETVLAAMRRHPDWFESYVERPLGRKQAPVAVLPVDEGTARPLALGSPDDGVETEMRTLASRAVEAIGQRLGRGEDTHEVVAKVIRTVFGGALKATLDRAPHESGDPLGGVTGALADPVKLNRIVTEVRTIINDREG